MSKFVKAWYEFMYHQLGAITRSKPNNKVRKFEHIEIQQDFARLEENRKKQRLKILTHKKQVMANALAVFNRKQQQLRLQAARLKTQNTKLLKEGSKQTEKSIESKEFEEARQTALELQKIDKELEQFKSELKDIDLKLETTESEYVQVVGLQKQIIDNHITYIKHQAMHPFGFVLHPETMKAVEQVDYLIQHNLPVPKFTLYEVMPELFTQEIMELEQSMRRLIIEKLPKYEAKSQSLINVFEMKRILNPNDKLQLLIHEKNTVWNNVDNKTLKMLEPFGHLIKKIDIGETRYRSWKHFMFECIDIQSNDHLNPEEIALKKVVLEIVRLFKEFDVYMLGYEEKVKEIAFARVIPAFVFNNPKLLDFYKKRMNQVYDRIVDIRETVLLPCLPDQPNLLEERIREELDKQLSEDFKMEGSNRDRLNKNETKVRVMNIMAKVMQEFPTQYELLEGNVQSEKFETLDDKKRHEMLGLTHVEPSKIKLDELTKTLDLNNKDPAKYNLRLFSGYFGIDEATLRNVFNYVSYPKVSVSGKTSILKFKA